MNTLNKTIVLLSILTIICSCSGYATIGEKFLNASFSSSWYDAENSLSDELSYDDKQDLKEYISDLKREFGTVDYKFKYRAGYKYDLLWSTYATGYYSCNDDKNHILFVDFEKQGKKWVVDDIGESSIEDIVNEYSISQQDYAQAKESGNDDKIKTLRTELKENKKVVFAFKDFFDEDQWESFINSK